MIINCDIGERGAWHPVDHALMNHIGMANIACGGHAGDAESVAVFTGLAREKNLLVSAHLSYPDRDNFGRVSIELPIDQLLTALDAQFELSLEKERVKFHGALYNDSVVDQDLAEVLSVWLDRQGVQEIVTPFNSCLALACRERGIAVCSEAFAERRYEFDPATGRLLLANRVRPYASIHDLEDAVAHSMDIFSRHTVKAIHVMLGDEPGSSIFEHIIQAETLCIHSDSAIALPLAARLNELFRAPC